MENAKMSGLCPHGNYPSTCLQCQAAGAAKAAKTLDDLMAELSETKMTPDQRRELIKATWAALKEAFVRAGGEFHEKVDEVYRALKGQELLIRREDPKRIADAVTKKEDIALKHDPALGERYANVSLWSASKDDSGLTNAFNEGHGTVGGMVTVMGFDQGSLSVEKVPGLAEIGTAKRHNVRSAVGEIHPGDIRFVIVGIPGSLFPSEELTDLETERLEENKAAGAKRVLRGFLFPKGAEAEKAA